jgi:universal stress protein A
MRKILVPTDFSEPSRQALSYALELATAVEGYLLLLHVVEQEPLGRYIVGEAAASHAPWVDHTGYLFQCQRAPTIIYHDHCEEARWKLSSLLPPGYPERFRPMVTVGKAGGEIARVAREEKVDLILMGSHGRRRWRHFLWPNVPDQVLRQTAVPVMLFCPIGHSPSSQAWGHEMPWLSEVERDPWPEIRQPEAVDTTIPWRPEPAPPSTSATGVGR